MDTLSPTPKKGILKTPKPVADPKVETKLRRAVRQGVLNKVGPATQASTSKKSLDCKGLNILGKKRVTINLPEKIFLPQLMEEAKTNFQQALPYFSDEKHKRTIQKLFHIWKAGEFTAITQKNFVDLSECILENDIAKSKDLLTRIARADLSLEMALFWKRINEMVADIVDGQPGKYQATSAFSDLSDEVD